MYSPKIKEDLIPKIYQLARIKRIPMTKLVNQVLEKSIGSSLESEKREMETNLAQCKQEGVKRRVYHEFPREPNVQQANGDFSI